jgi:hypothetical protein
MPMDRCQATRNSCSAIVGFLLFLYPAYWISVTLRQGAASGGRGRDFRPKKLN